MIEINFTNNGYHIAYGECRLSRASCWVAENLESLKNVIEEIDRLHNPNKNKTQSIPDSKESKDV